MRVKIKKALLKDTFKEIKKSYKRFISILLMALLGVGFFAGLRATSPDMVDSIDTYYKNQNVYDIEIMSTLGLTDVMSSLLIGKANINFKMRDGRTALIWASPMQPICTML